MALANELGAAGEKAAQRYLLSRRIRILEINWRDPLCEIDIIASDERHLLIVEVKSRMEYTATSPLDAINVSKAHQMMLGGMRSECASTYRYVMMSSRHSTALRAISLRLSTTGDTSPQRRSPFRRHSPTALPCPR